MPRGPFFSHRPTGFGGNIFSGGDVRETLQREMNRVFDEIWRNLPSGEEGSDGPRPAANPAAPSTGRSRGLSVDVSETADAVRVRADLPGVAEDDVDVTLDDDRLTIRAERRIVRSAEGETSHASECAVGVLERTLTLPAAVDPEQVEAAFDRGVLTVTLQKPRASERGRKIPVRSATGASAPTTGGLTGASAGSGDAFMQGDGAMGASPSTGSGAEPATDSENAARPGGVVHGYNE